MNGSEQAKQIERLFVEMTAQRLILRGIVAHLLLANDEPISATLKAFAEAVEKMSPEIVPIPDLDPALHRKAAFLARTRAQKLLENIGTLLRPSPSKTLS